jgi:hypothetical protein
MTATQPTTIRSPSPSCKNPPRVFSFFLLSFHHLFKVCLLVCFRKFRFHHNSCTKRMFARSVLAHARAAVRSGVSRTVSSVSSACWEQQCAQKVAFAGTSTRGTVAAASVNRKRKIQSATSGPLPQGGPSHHPSCFFNKAIACGGPAGKLHVPTATHMRASFGCSVPTISFNNHGGHRTQQHVVARLRATLGILDAVMRAVLDVPNVAVAARPSPMSPVPDVAYFTHLCLEYCRANPYSITPSPCSRVCHSTCGIVRIRP